MEASPFNLENDDAYKYWRDAKLKDYPSSLDRLVVEINDPRTLTQAEFDALLKSCQKTNMALYAGKTGDDPDPEIPLSIGRRFGVYGINKNWLADKNALTSLTVREEEVRQHYIPYTNKAINWHTDGYYNSPDKQVHSLLMHSVKKSAKGGENSLLDHEIVYILLRDENPDHIRALMCSDVMSIPPRMNENGAVARNTETGPVFSIMDSGDLHMRYTIRKKNVVWACNSETKSAITSLRNILDNPSPYKFQGLLESGMGLIGNNILHTRNAFEDNQTQKRHYYRARYFERLAGTTNSEVYFSH